MQLSGGLNIYTHHWCDQIFAPCLYVLFERGCLGNAAGRKNAGKWAGEWILVESTGVERLTRKKKKKGVKFIRGWEEEEEEEDREFK